MDIDIQRISERGIHLQGALSIDRESLLEESAYLLDEVAYDLSFVRNKEEIRVSGQLKTVVMLACVRCLEEYEMPIDTHFDVVMFPASVLVSADNEVKDEEIEYIFYEGNKVDLAKILNEQINLSLPFNPVCQEACKGLCSNCGSNLNQQGCRCDHSGSEVSLLFDKIKR